MTWHTATDPVDGSYKVVDETHRTVALVYVLGEAKHIAELHNMRQEQYDADSSMAIIGLIFIVCGLGILFGGLGVLALLFGWWS